MNDGTRAGDTAPGERRTRLRDVYAAAAIMVGTLLDAAPDRREWLEGAVAKQAQAFPGADKLKQASEEILREVDEPMSVIRELDLVERAGGDEAAGFSEEQVQRSADHLRHVWRELEDMKTDLGPAVWFRMLARQAVLAALAPAGSPEAKEQECSTDGVRFAMALNEKRCERGNHEYGERGYCVNCGVDEPEEPGGGG